MTYIFVCPECHQPFICKAWDQTFCSLACASRHRQFERARLVERLYKSNIDVHKLCFFNRHIPEFEIERLMEEKQVEEKRIGI
jgi:hypothetical protein